MSSFASGVSPGDVIGGKFRVEAIIGEGGMAFVMVATHLHLDERVALKFIHWDARHDVAAATRFRSEARAVARMKGEHVARVMDVSTTDDGHPFMVMEYLDGEDLGRVVERRPLPDRVDVVGWMIEACEGLAEAHANGIVHRDVKPENLFLVERPGGERIVKLLDFGISKLAVTSGSSTSGQHAGLSLIGTPTYMAPEQVRSAMNADPRSDQWSLGAVLYELLSGELPFVAESTSALCLSVLSMPHRPIELHVPDLHPELRAIIDRCLEKDPAARFPSVADLAVALLPHAYPRHRLNIDRMQSQQSAAGLIEPSRPPALPSTRDPRPTDEEPIPSTLAAEAHSSSRARFAWWIAVVAITAIITSIYVVARSYRSPPVGGMPTPSASMIMISVPVVNRPSTGAASNEASATHKPPSPTRTAPRPASKSGGKPVVAPATATVGGPLEIKLER